MNPALRQPTIGELTVDGDQARLQLKIIRITVRAEARRVQAANLEVVQLRAHEILDRLEAQAVGDPELLSEIDATRREVGRAGERG
jgi:hypothetical protein